VKKFDKVQAIGFSLWKRPFCQPYIQHLAAQIVWHNTAQNVNAIVTWGAQTIPSQLAHHTIIRMEDGFLHSAGLGSDLTPPMSQILDSKGIYFDARTPNNLTDLLNTYQFSDAELARAEALRQAICQAGLTKYNLGRCPVKWALPRNQAIILVPGQVADDASVKFGTAQIQTIDALLKQVRLNHPDAYIVYKPHPDVLSGNRQGLVEAQALCDKVELEADIISLIEVADEVHTLSSLAGFDALLRQKKVVTYGMPFYAGWGLTEDKVREIPFRERTLNLQALVAASLILYPLYWDWTKREMTTPEVVVERLATLANRPKVNAQRRIMRLLGNLYRWARNVSLYYLAKDYKEH
jgi:capsular polysaccharide export protein